MAKRVFRLKFVTIWASLISGVLVLIFAYLFAFWIQLPIFSTEKIDPAIFGQFGDVIGGVVGTFLGFLSVFLLYKTYQSQKKELKATQDAMYDQKNDTAIFSMLSTLRSIVSEMEGDVVTVNSHTGQAEVKQLKGREYFHQVLESIKGDFGYENIEPELIYNPATERLHAYREEKTGVFNEHGNEGVRRVPLERPSYQIEITRDEIAKEFLRRFGRFSYNFDHYFRFFQNIFKFIGSIEYKEDKNRYFEMLKSQLSQDEFVMLFYFVLSSDTAFLRAVDISNLLDPILNPRSMIDVWHHWHFPRTDFKFLWEQELTFKREYRRKHEIT